MSNDNKDDIFKGLGVKIELNDSKSFVIIMETLTRIGVFSEKTKTLFQSCHILHKDGQYAIMHFKELFILDGRESDISVDDLYRRNKITRLLQKWDLCKILPNQIPDKDKFSPEIKIIPSKDKHNFTITPKYVSLHKRKKKDSDKSS